MLDWENIKTLQALAEAGTVRGAAEYLGVHHATVSRRIEQLEQSLGTRLVDRKPEGLEIRAPAEDLVALARNFSEQLQASQRRIEGRDSELKGRVILTMGAPMGESLFAPELPAFADRYPQLELHIVSTFSVLDLSRREADIAIRAASNPTPTLVGKRLCSVMVATYASPAYIEANNILEQPENARWIGFPDRTKLYAARRDRSPFKDAPVWGNIDEISLQLACAKQGLGLVSLPCIMGDKHPDLVRVDGGDPQPFYDLWLLTHNDLRHTARIRAVMDFSEQVLRKHKAAFEGRLEQADLPATI